MDFGLWMSMGVLNQGYNKLLSLTLTNVKDNKEHDKLLYENSGIHKNVLKHNSEEMWS